MLVARAICLWVSDVLGISKNYSYFNGFTSSQIHEWLLHALWMWCNTWPCVKSYGLINIIYTSIVCLNAWCYEGCWKTECAIPALQLYSRPSHIQTLVFWPPWLSELTFNEIHRIFSALKMEPAFPSNENVLVLHNLNISLIRTGAAFGYVRVHYYNISVTLWWTTTIHYVTRLS